MQEKIRMRLGVIADHVTSGDNFPDQLGALPRILADQEKCGVGVVTIEEVQQVWGDRGIRAVVEGDRERARRGGAAGCGSEELRTRVYSAIGGERRDACQRGGRSDHPWIHAAILA